MEMQEKRKWGQGKWEERRGTGIGGGKENGERRGTGQPQTKLEIHPDSDTGNIPVIFWGYNVY